MHKNLPWVVNRLLVGHLSISQDRGAGAKDSGLGKEREAKMVPSAEDFLKKVVTEMKRWPGVLFSSLRGRVWGAAARS